MQNEKADLTDAPNKHRVALNSSQRPLEGAAIAGIATVFAPSGLSRQVLDLKAENLSLKELNQELMQNSLSASGINTGKKFDRLFAAISSDVLKLSLRVDRRFVFWVAKSEQALYGP